MADSPQTLHNQGDGSSLAAVATEPNAQQTDATTAKAAGLSGAPDHVVDDFLPINGTDYVEFYVGNAKQAALLLRLRVRLRDRRPTGGRRRGTARPRATSSSRTRSASSSRPRSTPTTRSPQHVAKHGDGVKDIALWVDDATKSFEEVTKRGAVAIREPEVLEDEHGRVVLSAMGTYGDTIHTFVERKDYDGLFLPGFETVGERRTGSRSPSA